MALAKLKMQTESLYTVREYLELERDALERSIYLDGEIILMAGETLRHGDICVNLVREISLQLKGRDCRVLTKDTKTKSGGFSAKKLDTMKGMFSYPDLVIICGEPQVFDKRRDIILNPTIVIEVLSASTEVFDRNAKFVRYRMFNPTLTDYILVSQDKPQIEHFIRQDDNSWKLYTYLGLDEALKIEAVDCHIALREIYDRVKFTKEELLIIEELSNIK